MSEGYGKITRTHYSSQVVGMGGRCGCPYMEISMFVYYLGGGKHDRPAGPTDDSPVLGEDVDRLFDVFYLDNELYDTGSVYSADRCDLSLQIQGPAALISRYRAQRSRDRSDDRRAPP